MTEPAPIAGWIAALLTAVGALATRRALGTRMERVARACHELRGPITAARLGLELGTRAGELSPAHLRAIDSELGRAALALEDLASVRGPARRPALGLRGHRGLRALRALGGCAEPPGLRCVEPVDVVGLLSDSVEAWRPAATAAGKSVRLRCPDGAGFVSGDRLRLAQATGNLIANAIEHGGAEVDVRATFDRGARIEVADDGPGLPAPVGELARRPRKGRGSRGRGLAIAVSIAAAHGGRLRNAPASRGARLVLELPIQGHPAARRPTGQTGL